jgi:hypothetical protein
MSSYSQPRLKAFKAGSAITGYTFVKFGADEKTVVPCALNERAIGIAQCDQANVGGPVDVALPGGGAALKISEDVALGKLLTSTAGALGEVADAAGEWVGAIAHKAGVANDVIAVEVIQTQAQASDA